MIVCTGSGLDWGVIIGVSIPVAGAVIGLMIFAIKALIHKTVAPLKNELDNMVGKMTVVEKNYVSLLEEIRKLPDTIDEKAKSREALFNLELKHLKEDLDKKQDK